MEPNGINGDLQNGHPNGDTAYSVPDSTSEVFNEAILSNPLISSDLPSDITSAARKLNFTGSPSPSIPVNWRLAEAVSSIKALEACLVNVLLKRKYDTPMQDVTINTDHATLFFMSAGLWTIDPGEGRAEYLRQRISKSEVRSSRSSSRVVMFIEHILHSTAPSQRTSTGVRTGGISTRMLQ